MFKKGEKVNSTIRWLLAVPGRKKWYVAILVLLNAINGATGVFYALLLRNIVDSAVAGDTASFWRYSVLIVLLVLFQLGVSALSRWLIVLSRSELENIFKKRLAENILRKDYASVTGVHTGEWLNRLTSDTDVVARTYTEILPGLVGTVVRLISALVMIVALDYRFAFILIPGGAALIVLTCAFRGKLKRLHKIIQEKDGKLRVFLQEHLGSLMIVKSFSAEDKTLAEAGEKMEEHKQARLRRNRLSNLSAFGLGVAIHGMYLIGVIYCAYGILHGLVTYGTLTAIMQLIAQLQAPLTNISGYLPKYYAMIASAERLMEIEKLEPDMTGEPVSKAEARRFYGGELASFGLRDASFTYPSREDDPVYSMPTVLEHFSIEIGRGEYVAFTGHSGCGKSTVLKLLMCMYKPESGSGFFRTRSGEELALAPEWRSLFAYVPQGNQLMTGTLREVVSIGDPGAANDDEKLTQALDIACAGEFLAELDKGLDTPLGERGSGLSEGQMQRVAIARALFSGAPILLLDEATSALDENTEKRLLTNLRELTDRTVIIVTHRPAALSICDRVIAFSEGGAAEQRSV